MRSILKNKKKNSIKNLIIGLSAMALTIVYLLYFVLKVFGTINNEVVIELGTKSVSLSNFVMYGFDTKKADFITDVKELDLTKVSEYKVKVKYEDKSETSKLKIVDTTSPEVVVKGISKYLNYEPNAEDFIVSVNDLSETKSKVTNKVNTSKFGNYNIILEISDIYGNKTIKTANLEINWIATSVTHELGTKFDISEIIMNVKEDKDKINAEELEKVNPNEVGNYIVHGTYDDVKYTSVVSVVDSTPPVIKLKNLEVYIGKTAKIEDFVVSIEDKSTYKLSSNKDIDFTKLGIQEIKIIVTDLYGNSSSENVTILIKEDLVGPVFSGVDVIKVIKNAKIDYNSGIKAIDDNDGSCEFKVDSTTVNVSKAGTYYATYTAKDVKGNITTAKRKVIVTELEPNVDEKFNAFYSSYLKGKTALQMTRTVRDMIWYNHNSGGSDPILYALNNRTGDCKVHALFMQAAFNKAGIENMIIHTIDKTHYWNLVKIDGVWRHYDSTPGKHLIGPCTDSEKAKSSALYGRKWDTSLYPAAN